MANRIQRSRAKYLSSVMLLLGGLFGLGASGGCSSDDGEAADDACLSNRAFFAQKVWGPVVSQTCINCHSPDGIASDKGAGFQLLPPGYPGFLDANLRAFAEAAKVQSDGKSVVLRKPLGELSHGGGVQLTEDSREYKLLAQFVARLGKEESCGDSLGVANFPDVDLYGELATFRKASLQLTGSLPSAEEFEALRAGGIEALPEHIEGLFERPEFYRWVKETYNDVFLTNRYVGYDTYALNILNSEQFPYSQTATDELSGEERSRVNRAVAEEPLELIVHVVKNNLPYTEILTADYTMMNPFSARVYNAELEFSSPEDPTEFKPGKIRANIDGGLVAYPQAGLLTSPMWLNRFPTTPTNRNRHRARMVMDFFLATDILGVVNRPIDAADAAKFQNPTRDDPSCNGCHRQLDPIAGAFQKFDQYDAERYRPDAQWHSEMFPPGFGNETMQTSDFAQAPQWLAQRLVRDQRFTLSAVHILFRALTGHKPLQYPADSEMEHFADHLAAWEAQDATFRSIANQFEESNYNLKVVIREIILSPYYRARGAGSLSANREVQLQGVGTARFETPESLSRKLTAVVGTGWTRSWDERHWLNTDYNILYGGIDSDTITQRLTSPNGVMANVAWRMANEVACMATAYDFVEEPAYRALFPYVTLAHVPETDTGDSAPSSVETIKKNIQYLHARILGEDLALDHAEIQRTYQLFYETWKEGRKKVLDGEVETWLPWACQARVDRATGSDLPEQERIQQDELYTVRAWMAVVTYLTSDYRFLHE